MPGGANTSPHAEIRGALVAISVAKLDAAIARYEQHLAFRVLRRKDYPEHQVRTAFLVAGDFQRELIERAGSKSFDRCLAALAADGVQLDREDPRNDTILIQGYQKLAFEVRDLDAWMARLKRAGVRLVYPEIADDPDARWRWMMIEDGERNTIQLVERR